MVVRITRAGLVFPYFDHQAIEEICILWNPINHSSQTFIFPLPVSCLWLLHSGKGAGDATDDKGFPWRRRRGRYIRYRWPDSYQPLDHHRGSGYGGVPAQWLHHVRLFLATHLCFISEVVCIPSKDVGGSLSGCKMHCETFVTSLLLGSWVFPVAIGN